jgi:arylsulfatase A-like enzyme
VGLVFVACAADPERAHRPNLILITLDTTRADHLGCYGYERETSPELDRLALDSVVFDRAYSTSSWTLAAHASLFTGKFPSSHGARYDPDGPLALTDGIDGPSSLRDWRARGLTAEQHTLAEILGDAGYATAAIVAGPWMKRVFGLDHGYAHYDDAGISSMQGRLAAQVTDAAIAWIDTHADRPFHLFLNYYDPHGPYRDPERLASLFLPPGTVVDGKTPTLDLLRAYYDGEIRYMDRHIGRLLARLRELELYEDSWILVTADHGELHGEHGKLGHGRYLFEEEIRVPLLVKYPSGEVAPGRSARPIQLTDILPMVIDRLGLPTPPDLPPDAQPDTDQRLFAEVYPLRPTAGRNDGDWRALIDGRFKFLWNSRGAHRLFDLESDPRERVDLASQQPELVRAMAAEIDAFVAALPEPGPAGPPRIVDEDTRRALRELGYLE